MKRIIFILLTIMLSSCYADDSTPSPDSRFTGSWFYYLRESSSTRIEEESIYYSFDDTNEVYYSYENSFYSLASGYSSYENSDFYIWTVNGNQLCLSGLTCKDFEFKNGSLFINGKELKR